MSPQPVVDRPPVPSLIEVVDRPRGSSSGFWPAGAALAALPLLGLLACAAATRTTWLLPEDRPVPASMDGPLGHVGLTLGQPAVVVLLAAILCSYVLTLRWVDQLSPSAVIAAVVAVNLVVLLGPPLFSTDLFSYQAYARMFANYHANPYAHGPSIISANPIYALIGPRWVDTASVYGPLFTLLSGIFASASLATSQLIFRLIAALATGGTACLIWRSARLRRVDPTRGVALFGLNPLVTLYGVGGGHNDMLMLLLTTAAVYSILSRRDGAAGVLVSAGTAIKLTGGILLPFALLAVTGADATRRRRAFVFGFVLATVVIAVASAWAFGASILHLPSTITSAQDHPTWKSGPGSLFAATGLQVTGVVRVVLDLILLAWVVYLLREVWLDRMDWIEGAAWATVAVLATAWSFLPWYVAWMLPLVALCRSSRLWNAAIVLTLIATVFMVSGTLPNGVTFL